ncbi:MAG: hypothetical protein HW421_3221 [Ignavibacteria bacterium]|nr:hypothetical protein [Ignavibacteria bacterium]
MNYKILVLSIISLSFFLNSCKDNPSNPTSNNDTIVTIGTQVWMKRNLDVDHYRNGDSIPEVRDAKQWANLTTGAWCYYNNDFVNGILYGKLYNWYAVNDPRGLAPPGWHIPSDSEWTTLITNLGGADFAGGKLKETGTKHWQNPNTGASNETGFSALPGGRRYLLGTFNYIGYCGILWSSTVYDVSLVWCRYLYNDDDYIGNFFSSKENGFSVRCIKNN